MASISPQARARRRRRKLLLSATLATGAVWWGARKAGSTDDGDAPHPASFDHEPGDGTREDEDEDALHDSWPS